MFGWISILSIVYKYDTGGIGAERFVHENKIESETMKLKDELSHSKFGNYNHHIFIINKREYIIDWQYFL